MPETLSSDAGSVVQELSSLFEDFHGAEMIEVDGIPIAKLPTSVRLESVKKLVDEYATAPDRRKGTATVGDLVSFVLHVNRFRDDDSVIFAHPDPRAPTLTAVLDYNRPGENGARFGEHRTLYNCPLSEEWLAWHGENEEVMGQGEFAEFIENRIGDVIIPPASFGDDPALQSFVSLVGGLFADPAKLLELSRGLEVNAQETVKQAVNLGTGEISVTYQQTHGDGRGQAIRVPNLFLIGIPVFRSGEPYRIPVRLRYRISGQALRWSYHLYRADRVFDHAFGEVMTRAGAETGLPVLTGSAEK